MRGKLILEDGTTFTGKAFGYLEEAVGEVVFNTSMTGYQEILTDPSYYGQIVTMTYPLVGNYGINLEDKESDSVKVRGFIVREKCNLPFNFRCEMDLDTYLKQLKVIGLEEIDTRALTKLLRYKGIMKGVIVLDNKELRDVQDKLAHFDNSQAVSIVSPKEVRVIPGPGKRVSIMDFGIKTNIIRNFQKRQCHLTIFPSTATAKEVLAANPDLIFLSNGPGDPEDLKDIVATVKELIGKKPIGGICLGHQILAIALGGKTGRLKFGHRGGNHPVFSTSKLGRVEVSLGPEMKSTGEVLGVGKTIEEALYKGFLGVGKTISDQKKKVLATINDKDKKEFLEMAKAMHELGYTFVATTGTAKSLEELGIPCHGVNRVEEERPNILDIIRNKEVDLVINTPTKGNDSTRDGFKIRRTAIEFQTDIMTSLDTVRAMVAVKRMDMDHMPIEVYSLEEIVK